jgi:hypothetical protein
MGCAGIWRQAGVNVRRDEELSDRVKSLLEFVLSQVSNRDIGAPKIGTTKSGQRPSRQMPQLL